MSCACFLYTALDFQLFLAGRLGSSNSDKLLLPGSRNLECCFEYANFTMSLYSFKTSQGLPIPTGSNPKQTNKNSWRRDCVRYTCTFPKSPENSFRIRLHSMYRLCQSILRWMTHLPKDYSRAIRRMDVSSQESRANISTTLTFHRQPAPYGQAFHFPLGLCQTEKNSIHVLTGWSEQEGGWR